MVNFELVLIYSLFLLNKPVLSGGLVNGRLFRVERRDHEPEAPVWLDGKS
jgi:hypothetical protein